jgi:hypothetical protein
MVLELQGGYADHDRHYHGKTQGDGRRHQKERPACTSREDVV